MIIRNYQPRDTEELRQIWNQIVEDGQAFPQENHLSFAEAQTFFAEQTHLGVAENNNQIEGFYILHPNNVGRCGHIANTSYAVAKQARGKKNGETLVKDSIEQAKKHGFRILQFNAVVANNFAAVHLYQKLGFTQLGTIPDGFLLKDGSYIDIYPFYLTLI